VKLRRNLVWVARSVENAVMKWPVVILASMALSACMSAPDAAWRRTDGVDAAPNTPARTQILAALLICTADAERKYPERVAGLSRNALTDAANDFNRDAMAGVCMKKAGYVRAP
jgi:hypothetical protein